MIEFNGYYIFINQKDFLSHVSMDKLGDTYFKRMLIKQDNPKKFPVAYKYSAPWYNENCGRLYLCPLEEAKTAIEKECFKYIQVFLNN